MRRALNFVRVLSLAVIATYGVIASSPGMAREPAPTTTHFTPTPYVLEDRRLTDLSTIGNPLFTPDEGYDYASALSGVFMELKEDIYGYSLYMFPNGKFAVWHDCHCKTPAYFMYFGSWRRDKNVISFALEQKATGKGCAADFREFATRFGELSKMDLLMTVQDGAPGSVVLAPEATLMKAPMDRLFVRDHELRDWKSKLAQAKSDLEKNTAAH